MKNNFCNSLKTYWKSLCNRRNDFANCSKRLCRLCPVWSAIAKLGTFAKRYTALCVSFIVHHTRIDRYKAFYPFNLFLVGARQAIYVYLLYKYNNTISNIVLVLRRAYLSEKKIFKNTLLLFSLYEKKPLFLKLLIHVCMCDMFTHCPFILIIIILKLTMLTSVFCFF